MLIVTTLGYVVNDHRWLHLLCLLIMFATFLTLLLLFDLKINLLIIFVFGVSRLATVPRLLRIEEAFDANEVVSGGALIHHDRLMLLGLRLTIVSNNCFLNKVSSGNRVDGPLLHSLLRRRH